VGSTYPGVEIHANLIAGILNGEVKLRPSYSLGAEVIELLLVGVLLAGLLPLLSPGRASLLAGSTFVGLVLFNLMLWNWGNLVFPLASALLLIALLFALNMSWGYFVESRSRRQFTELFGQYVPPELVDEMARDPERYNMEGRNAELTVLFSDVRDFTTLSEGLDPKELTQLMNEYLGVMTNVIRKYRGTLDKYIGDAIMAFWGAPMNDPEHARNAVLAALEMQQATAELSRSFRERNWPALRIGVGLNSGLMTVGDMGSPVRKAYTVMGDAVNLASRLEGLTKQYGVGLIVGQDTRNAIKDFAFRELDRVRVKGKDEPVVIYEPLGPAEAQTASQKDAMRQWQQFLRLYRACDWEQAELQLVNLERLQPGNTLYRLYATRIQYLRAHPPGANWDGVTTFQTK
jgi:adenylate cyclase